MNPTDGSCWMADGNGLVVVFLADGMEWAQSASGAFSAPRALSVNPTDGSCWVADTGHGQVVKVVLRVAPPSVSFSATPRGGIPPVPVNFTNQSTNSPTSWSWTFGDGGASTAQNPSHTYNAVGSYAVALTATNAGGSNTLSKSNFITIALTWTTPVAGFTGTPTSGMVPLHVNFTDSSTNTPTSWSWTFGDGGNSSGRNPGHAYSAAGSYTVALTATNPGGSNTCTQSNYITVTAPPAPVAGFMAPVTSGPVPLFVAFTDTSTNNPTSWSWTFGDGGTSTIQNPTYTYFAVGSYTVALTATNGGGTTPAPRTTTLRSLRRRRRSRTSRARRRVERHPSR